MAFFDYLVLQIINRQVYNLNQYPVVKKGLSHERIELFIGQPPSVMVQGCHALKESGIEDCTSESNPLRICNASSPKKAGDGVITGKGLALPQKLSDLSSRSHGICNQKT